MSENNKQDKTIQELATSVVGRLVETAFLPAKIGLEQANKALGTDIGKEVNKFLDDKKISLDGDYSAESIVLGVADRIQEEIGKSAQSGKTLIKGSLEIADETLKAVNNPENIEKGVNFIKRLVSEGPSIVLDNADNLVEEAKRNPKKMKARRDQFDKKHADDKEKSQNQRG